MPSSIKTAVAVALLLCCVRARADEAVLLLPVEGAEAQALEERLLIALGARARSERDIPQHKRRHLPADLGRCLAPDCLAALADAAGTERVLSLRYVSDGARTTMFTTLYQATRGEILKRAEWDASRPSLVTDLASWVRGEPPPIKPPPPPLPTVAVSVDGVHSVEGDALAAAVTGALAEFRDFRTLPPGARSPATHRARVTVEQAHVATRVHLVHRYRSGALAATLTIADARTGAVVFARHAEARIDERADGESDAQAMQRLVAEVVQRWCEALRGSGIEAALARSR